MKVDSETLMIVLTLVGLVQVAALLSLVRINRVHRGQGWMALGNGLLSMGFLLLYLRDAADIGLVSVAGGNVAFIFGMIFVCLGVLRFIGNTASYRWLVVINVIIVIISLYFTFFDDVFAARGMSLSLSIALSASIAA
ncbi:MAG TPA: hypothetical protein VMV44_08345, partial [Rectinemataceae bacterium]|nr:hypothetical protein [Rectinemataceae bacterium]